MKNTIKKYEIHKFWYEIASQRYEKINPKGMKNYIPKVWKIYTQRYENDVKGMKKYQRKKGYEKDAQGMK